LGGYVEVRVFEQALHGRLPLGVWVSRLEIRPARPLGDVDVTHLGVIDEGAEQAEPDETRLADHDTSIVLPALKELLRLPGRHFE
jgi:hypothetical protein